MSLRSSLLAQFKRPTGSLGALAGWVMASRPSNIARNRWTIDLLDLAPSDTVLEIGCGPGVGLAYAASKLKQGKIIGIDHSPVMMRQASRRMAREIRSGKASVHQMIADEVASLGEKFDKIYSANVAQFFADPASTLGALRACLKPGGLVATTHQPRAKSAGPEDATRASDAIAAALLAAGYCDIRRETLALRPAPAICVLARQSSRLGEP